MVRSFECLCISGLLLAHGLACAALVKVNCRSMRRWPRRRRFARRSSNCVAFRTFLRAALMALLEGSDIRMSHLEGDERVLSLCLLFQPQLAGAALDLLMQVARTLTIEANAVTDNPLVLVETSEIVSVGIFPA